MWGDEQFIVSKPGISMNRPPNQGSTVILYIFGISLGIGLLLAAIVVFLRAIGTISEVSSLIIWSIILFSIGVGILTGLSMRR
jgi:hypothetical protein